MAHDLAPFAPIINHVLHTSGPADQPPDSGAASTAEPARMEPVAGRYAIHELLGRGGMACVYRATDLSTGKQLALKQLTTTGDSQKRARSAALFEREFHTLMQLQHPHVISVYDYGFDADRNPYYTMELLDGGDLRERSPLGYREACRLLFDVCSSLALLHSRRLLHRDVSPRNVRCTHDGRAKLIDFGAMAPMTAGGADIVGTPAFMPPETLHRLALDARTDLYSLGATLYYALTGSLPYPAYNFADLQSLWTNNVLPPSAYVADIPAALDDLVLALINLEPTLRPQSAFEVMHQLAAIAGLSAAESEAVSRAYLATPTLVGREDLLATLRAKLIGARANAGTGVLLRGESGVGRSRVLDACALEAKTLGFTALRATASATGGAFAIARGLVKHLHDAVPGLESAAAPLHDSDAARLQQEFGRFLIQVSRTHPLLIAIDDVHRIDAASASVLAALSDARRDGGIGIALTADSDEAESEALHVLARRCDVVDLQPLTREQTHQLLGSVFGDVANLAMLSDEIHKLACGNPRQSMDLAQHLVDHGAIRYAAGTWTLPSRLSVEELPRSAAEALQARIAAMSEHARFLAEAHALAFYDALADEDYRALLPQTSSLTVEGALSELLMAGALTRSGALYTLASRAWTAAFLAKLSPTELQLRHRALAGLYVEKSSIATIHHCFAGGSNEQGLAAMIRHHTLDLRNLDYAKLLEQNVGKMMWCSDLAVQTATSLGYSPRAIHDLRRWHYGGSVTTEQFGYTESARLWFEQLAHDSGLDLYRLDTAHSDPRERLTLALQGAHQRYLATPEPERVYAVDEAIRLLGEYVVYSIAIAGRTYDSALSRSLPAILEPFAPLSPLLDAIWNNSIASYRAHYECHHEFARERWREVLEKLDTLNSNDTPFLEPMRNAIAYALGLMEAQLGLSSAASWATRLDRDPYQRVGALNLRKIVRLEQGDAHGAERYRRQAELLSLQTHSPPMFRTLLTAEIAAHTKARDLAGIQHVIEQTSVLAARYPAWVANALNAEGCFHLVRGDYDAARDKYEACIALTRPKPDGTSLNLTMWVSSQAGRAEALLVSHRIQEARDAASAALDVCDQRQIGNHAFDLVRILALAEARLGVATAKDRLDALIQRQEQLGVTGLRLGLSYEARAQIAIWSGDDAAFEHYAQLTAREYRHGAGSPLGARYERLMNEAARVGLRADIALTDFATTSAFAGTGLGSQELLTSASRSLAAEPDPEERARIALQLLCASHGVSVGHLYLPTDDAFVCAASVGNGVPGPELSTHVRAFVALERTRMATLDEMITGELTEVMPVTPLFQHPDGSYELVLLRCIRDGASYLAAVATLATNLRLASSDQQRQLLSVLAAHLPKASELAAD